MGLVDSGVILRLKEAEVDLGARELAGGEIECGILPDIEPALDDVDQAGGIRLLLLEGLEALCVTIKSDPGEQDVFGNGLLRVLEGEIGGGKGVVGGADVVALREREDEGLRLNGDGGGLTQRVPVGAAIA